MKPKKGLFRQTIHLMILSVLMMSFATDTFAQSSTDKAKKTDAIQVDGLLNEPAWDLATSASKVTEGSPNHTVTFDAVWDNTYLYVAGKILDDKLVADNGSEQPWNDDAFEVFIDADHNQGAKYDSYDRQFIVSYNSSSAWGKNAEGVLSAWKEISGGFTVEIAIPWSNLDIEPSAGTVIGFDIMADDDNDNSSRDGQTAWSGDGDNWQSTANFGDLTLTAEDLNDNEAPTVPAGLTTANISTTGLSLSWNTSTDNVGVAGYKVFKNGEFVEKTTSTTYSFTGLTPATNYSFNVEAYDAAGNTSAQSKAVNATTLSNQGGADGTDAVKTTSAIKVDGQLNEAVWNLATSAVKVTEGEPGHTVTFDAAWDNTYLYVAGKILDDKLVADNGTEQPWNDDAFEVFIDADHNEGLSYDAYDRQFIVSYNSSSVWGKNSEGVLSKWTEISGGFTVEIAIPWSNLDIKPSAGTVIGFDIMVDDDNDNSSRDGQTAWSGDGDNWKSTASFGDLTLTSENIDDNEAPTVPTGLATSGISQTSFTLSWAASNDNTGVTGYEVFKDGSSLGTTSALSMNITGLSCAKTYAMTVRATDAAGNWSAQSKAVNVTTATCGSALQPVVSLAFDENSGASTTNDGTGGGTFALTAKVPSWTSNTPENGGNSAIDFGTAPGAYAVESSALIPDLKNLSSFTIAMWVNCKNATVGSGGNRLVSWINKGGDGVDFVFNKNGSVTLSVNQWPDGITGSSAGKVTTDASAPESNWVFVAAAYTGTQVKYYFGNNTSDASLDVVRNYNRGASGANIEKLAIGHFNSATRNWATDRMFRGIIDNVQIFDKELSPAQIIEIQTGGDRYSLTVNNGSGDGRYLENATVQISADAPSTGMVFNKWEGQVASIADMNSPNTTLTMPAENITVTATYKADPNPYLVAEPTSLSFTKQAGNSDVKINSNIDWKATTNASWISISPASGSGDATLTISVNENTGTESRTGSVTISGKGASDQTVSVNQGGVEPSELTVTPTSLHFGPAASCKSIAITSNTDWTISESSGWAKVSQTSGSGDASVSVCVDANTSGIIRNFTMKISGTGVADQSIQVSQSDDSGPVQNIGVNVGFPGGMKDYWAAKPFADAWKQHREYQWSDGTNLDNMGWPTNDGMAIVYHGLKTKNNHGTYKLRFDCNNPSGVRVTGDINGGYKIENKQINGNRVTMDVVVQSNSNSHLFLSFKNTNGGVRNVTLMRPLTPGSSESYPEGTIWMDQFIDALKPFGTLRYMHWMASDSPNEQINWSDRTLWNYATQNTASIYGWGQRGPSWESVIMLANATQTDAFISVPIRATDDYIRNLALLFRDGNPELNVPPLDPNLKLYIEYGNEIWNWGTYGKQWNYVSTTAGQVPLTAFDGNTNVNERAFRYVAKRTVEFSNIFREVFGDDDMPAPGKDPEQIRIRPYIGSFTMWYDLVKQNTMFIDQYYNKRHPSSNWHDPHPVSYYIYGYGGSTYWSTDQKPPALTLNNIWNDGNWNSDNFTNILRNNSFCAHMYGLKYIAYEGGPHDDGHHTDTEVITYAVRDKRFYQKQIDQQNVFNKVGGDLNVYFTLMHAPTDKPSSEDYGGVFSILETEVSDYTPPRYRAMVTLSEEEPADIDVGRTPPFTVDGAAYDITERDFDKQSASGSKQLKAGGRYSAGYAVDVANSGNYNAEIEYTNGSGTIQVDVNGITVGTFNVSGSGTTPSVNFYCEYNTLYVVRVVCISGSVNIKSVKVGVGANTKSVNALEYASTSNSGLSIYPNPANGLLNIQLTETLRSANIDIVNIQGKVVSSFTLSSNNGTINVGDIPAGIYILSVKTANALYLEKVTIKQ